MPKLHSYPAKDSSKNFPKLKLTYFDATGRAEPIRIAFHIGGIPFEDERIGFQEWGALKAGTKFGQIPILTVDGKEIAQSYAILIYAAELSGLYPNDEFEQAKVNEILFLTEDVTKELGPWFFAATEEEKAAAKAKFSEEYQRRWLAYFDRQLHENNNGKYLVGNSLTIADLRVVALIDWLAGGMVQLGNGPLEAHPKLAAYKKNIENEHGVQAWYEAQKEHGQN